MAITIQFRGDTASNWASINPILAERELVLETDTKLMKIGNGSDNYNDLPYQDVRPIAEATILSMENQAIPTPPAPGFMHFFARSLAGKMLPRVQGPSGLVYPLQPSFFQNNIFIAAPGTTTAMTAIGDTLTSVGTISHPVVTEAYGRMANFLSAATAGITCGVGSTNLLACIGSIPNGANGFFFQSRFALPDASYDNTGASTGTRVFSGLTDTTMVIVPSADTLSNSNIAGFFRTNSSALQHANRQFQTCNGASKTTVDTGLPFLPQKVYDVFIFCAPQGTQIGWRIDNVSDGTSAEGIINTTLPTNTAFMRCGTQLFTINALARNLRIQRLYLDSDR